MPSTSDPQTPVPEPTSPEPSPSSTLNPFPDPDLEAGQQCPQPGGKGVTKSPFIFETEPSTFQHQTGLPRAVAELSTYTNKRVHRRFSRCRQAALLHQQAKIHRLEKQIDEHDKMRKITTQAHGGNVENDPVRDGLMDRLAREMLLYDQLLSGEKEIRSLPHPTRRQHRAAWNTLAGIKGVRKGIYEFLRVPDDCLVLEKNPAHMAMDYFLYEKPDIFRWLGLTLPTPAGRPRDVDSALLRASLAVLAVFASVMVMAIPASVIMLVPMTLGVLLVVTLAVVLFYSVVIVLVTPPDTLQHRVLGIAAMMTVLLAMATLRAEFEGVGM